MKKKIIILSIVVILIGIVMVAIKGFNVNLKYRAHEVAIISIDQDYSVKDIKNIAKEVLGKKEVQIEKYGTYSESVAIHSDEISDEQLQNIVNKINEKYNVNQKISITMNDGYEVADVENIAKEVLNNENVTVEKDSEDEKKVIINCGIVTEQKIENLVNKLNEKYPELNLTTGSVEVIKSANVSEYGKVALKDIAKQYMNYVIVSIIIILVYFAIIYRKLGVSKVLSNSVIAIVLGELLYIAILAIVRYPLDKLIIMAGVAIYLAIVYYLNCRYSKMLSEEKEVK